MGDAPRPRAVARVFVQVGLERVLYLAATDQSFRELLLAVRDAALLEAGLVLTGGEADVLAAVDRDTIATMIGAVQPQVRPQRPFLKAVAASCVLLATGAAMVECAGCDSAGIRPPDVLLPADAAIYQEVTPASDSSATEIAAAPDDPMSGEPAE